MFFVGIDLSDETFDSCMADAAGNVISITAFDFNDDGFYSFTDWLKKHKLSGENCLVGLENPRSRLVDFLIQRQYTILSVNPKALSRYRESRFPSNAKSDPDDAHLIADYIREHQKALRPIKIPDEKIRELRLLLEDRDRLVKQKVRFSNQLTNTLKDYFPQALDAFASIDNKCALEFLKKIDTYQRVKSRSSQEIDQLLDECRCYQTKSRKRFTDAMKQSPSQIPQEIVRAKTMLKNTLVRHLILSIESIKQYDELIQQVMSEIPNGDIFKSLPGADYILGAKLLVLYAGKDFSSANEAQVFYGTAPYTLSSGKYRAVRFRTGCHKFGRNAFQQLACGSIKTSIWARKQYARKRHEGKTANHAFRCVANLWVKVSFAMWQNKATYDETRHMASVADHFINQPAFVTND
jgi:transposase